MTLRFHSRIPPVNVKTRAAFRRDLVRWYRRHHRKLPWRTTRDPYKIWVSEIMLQQTRVDVVIDYYRRWLKTFPTVAALARAPYSRVLKLWEGLGYYSRAKNLHRAAQSINTTFKERSFLKSCNLLQLPGIGRYTAGAIASIAFDERAPLVDGNVARVFARVFGLRADVTKPATLTVLWSLAEVLLPERGCGEFNQALMELGALVCTPGEPECARCPMRRVCVAHATGIQAELPNRGPKRHLQPVIHDAVLVRRDGKILLRRRPATGLLANMWELPPLSGRPMAGQRPVLIVRHTITNRRITLRVFECGMHQQENVCRWVSLRQIRQLAMPAAHRRAVEQLAQRAVTGPAESGSRSRASGGRTRR